MKQLLSRSIDSLIYIQQHKLFRPRFSLFPFAWWIWKFHETIMRTIHTIPLHKSLTDWISWNWWTSGFPNTPGASLDMSPVHAFHVFTQLWKIPVLQDPRYPSIKFVLQSSPTLSLRPLWPKLITSSAPKCHKTLHTFRASGYIDSFSRILFIMF